MKFRQFSACINGVGTPRIVRVLLDGCTVQAHVERVQVTWFTYLRTRSAQQRYRTLCAQLTDGRIPYSLITSADYRVQSQAV